MSAVIVDRATAVVLDVFGSVSVVGCAVCDRGDGLARLRGLHLHRDCAPLEWLT